MSGAASGDGGSILARTARGAGWVIAWRAATRLLGLCSTLILVRLLAPADFGLVSLAAAVAATLDTALSFGVEDQIVRAHSPGRDLYDTAFTLNLLRAGLLALIVALAAAPAAGFVHDPRLEGVLLALAASAMISGLENVGTADFRRNLDFAKEFRLMLMPRLLGIAVTIGSAFVLHSHWALVAGILVNRAGVIGMGYAMHPFRPRLSLSAWRQLAGVSFWSWALGLVTLLRDRSDSLVVGRSLGTTGNGFYAVGIEVAALPATEMVDPLCRACMPGFAEAARSDQGAAESYLRIIATMALLTLPAGIGVSLMAGPVVALAFGREWLAAVPVVAIVGAAYSIVLFGNVSSALLNAQAWLSGIFRLTFGAGILRALLLVLLVPRFGLTGAAVALSVSVVAEQSVLILCAMHRLGLRAADFIAASWRPAIACTAMAAVLWAGGWGWAAAPESAGAAVRELAIGVPLGAAVYAAVLMGLWFACGAPRSAEADLLGFIGRTGRAALGRIAIGLPAGRAS
ncbi:lipopolysaccharide biosynthesis protein [Roseomonas sp. KE2513]|uniref:oligosaccharide flippase family protein n=1 Tax=Roseomonas sp. KE2513 TaxID=2479202 RepID=UPI0018DFB6D1|nr:oligosaccharide flippase family protein [Roseomonas sp. KE2513]MBI0537860.1 lipopolysaccharide biosynthesis protein [Roseomonas sp. KE2513]